MGRKYEGKIKELTFTNFRLFIMHVMLQGSKGETTLPFLFLSTHTPFSPPPPPPSPYPLPPKKNEIFQKFTLFWHLAKGNEATS